MSIINANYWFLFGIVATTLLFFSGFGIGALVEFLENKTALKK